MDFSVFDTTASDEGAIMEVRDPNGVVMQAPDGKPVTITLVGSDSKQFRSATRAATNRRLKGGRKLNVTAEGLEAEAIDILAACTLAWHGIMLDGKKFECTRENARLLYERFLFVREQVDEFIGDRGNFLKPSAKS